MLVDLDYHLWHSNMAQYRIRMLKADKRELQDELTRIKQYATRLEGENIKLMEASEYED